MTTTTEPKIVELTIESLAAGGDAVARDGGRVTFVPRAAPGDRVRARVTSETKSFARAELVEVLAPGPDRVAPGCAHFAAGCGGCQWQHVSRAAQLAAKQDVVARALRKSGATVHPIDTTTPELHWRRRARFHVGGGHVGLYIENTTTIVPIASCPQLDPALDAALKEVAAATPPSGELALVIGHTGEVVVGTQRRWQVPPRLIGRAGIVGVIADGVATGKARVEVEPGLVGGPWDFAQASADGNTALRAAAGRALGQPAKPGEVLLELHAGAGNLTRTYAAAGWKVIPSDVVAPPQPPPGFLVGRGLAILRRRLNVDALALDPPRTGCPEEVPAILELAPKKIVYVSCDPATLARDVGRLIEGGYRATDAWPLDLMPQTSHVEVVVRLTRA